MKITISLVALLLAFVTSAIADSSCVTSDVSFESFLVRFSTDKTFQLDRVVYPLRIKYTPPTSEQAVAEKWSRSKLEKIDWPLFLSSAELKKWGYVQTIRQASGVLATVRHDSGTDAYLRKFNFHKRNGCWYLEKLEDDSL